MPGTEEEVRTQLRPLMRNYLLYRMREKYGNVSIENNDVSIIDSAGKAVTLRLDDALDQMLDELLISITGTADYEVRDLEYATEKIAHIVNTTIASICAIDTGDDGVAKRKLAVIFGLKPVSEDGNNGRL